MWGPPTQAGYATFLANIVGIPASALPASFDGVATFDGATMTIVGVTDGLLVTADGSIPGPNITDAQGLIPPNTQVIEQIDGTPGGVGDYQLSNSTGVVPIPDVLPTPEMVSALNLQIVATFEAARETVNWQLGIASGFAYSDALYNLAADRLINYGQDVTNQSYFKDLQKGYNVNSMRVGVPSAVNDQGTSVGLLNPEWLKNVTMADLQYLSTPYGRAYLGFAQSVGTIWGLT